MQRVVVSGSTGSIGTSALDVISKFPDRFNVSALSTHSNIDLLAKQVKRFRPRTVSIIDKEKAMKFTKIFRGTRIKIYQGEEGLCNMLANIKADILVVGIVGSSALLPILTALDNIKTIALANKESLVTAGDIIMQKVKRKNVTILPVDSEHSAIFQCLESRHGSGIKKIYLTGSGGPLLKVPKKAFRNIDPKKAINHPKWKMGRKISIDSATMMNKGLEVIEAHHLFGVGIKDIEVLIHPEAAVHSMVEFIDGTILAHMATCDMRMPIQYALTYPSRLKSPARNLSFSRLHTLHFYSPDVRKFPCLRIAYEAAKDGGTYPCVLNASNEVAVSSFLKRRIRFTDIPRIVEDVLAQHKGIKLPKLKEILEVDDWARLKTEEIVGAISN